MRYAHVMFDLDGTMMNTSQGVIKSVRFVLGQVGKSVMSDEELKKFIGPPIEFSFEEFAGMSKTEAAYAAAMFRKVYPESYLFDAEYYSGIEQLVSELKGAGAVVSVATYKRGSYTCKLLKYFGIYEKLDHVIGSDEEGKLTKTDIIRKCIELSGTDRSETVLIGDTKHDAVSASEAGIDFIAVTYGFGFRSERDAGEYPYVHVCDNVKCLSDYLLSGTEAE